MIDKILYSLFELFVVVGGSIFGGIFNLFGWRNNNEHDYQGEFLDERDVLSKRNKGFNLTGIRSLSEKDSYSNGIVFGGSGVGKTSVVLIPSILSMEGSLIISDYSGELFYKVSGYLEKKGYEIKVLNYTKPEISIGFNILERANTKSEISKVASTLIRASMKNNSSNPFWDLQATALLTMLISLIKKQEPQYQNLVNVRRLLKMMSGDLKRLNRLVVNTRDESIYDSYKSFIAMAPNTFTGIAASTLAALNLFEDEQVARITSVDSLDVSSFRKRKVALFVQAPTIDMHYYSPLSSVLMEQLFSQVMKKLPEKQDQSIFFLLDEASSLVMPSLPVTISNIRKYNSGILLIYQDFNQVIQNFHKNNAETIRSNCYAKVYFTGQGLDTARTLEATLGKYTYEDEKGIKRTRQLMTADEIRSMPVENAIIICGHHRPILAEMRPYYKRNRSLSKTVYKKAEIIGDIPLGDVPLLPIPKT